MKRAIYIILLLLYTTLVHAYMYQSNMPTYQPQTRIGYTTNYSNGQFTPSAYKNLNTSTYSGTYNPYSNGNTNNGGSGRPGQPRRAKGYDETGKEYDTGSSEQGNPPDLWLPGYEYKWDGTYWYRTSDGGKNWEKWHTTLHLWYHWWGWGTVHPGKDAVTLYHENPVPIGDTTTPFLILMFAYLSYHEIKKRRHCKHFFCTFFYDIFG